MEQPTIRNKLMEIKLSFKERRLVDQANMIAIFEDSVLNSLSARRLVLFLLDVATLNDIDVDKIPLSLIRAIQNIVEGYSNVEVDDYKTGGLELLYRLRQDYKQFSIKQKMCFMDQLGMSLAVDDIFEKPNKEKVGAVSGIHILKIFFNSDKPLSCETISTFKTNWVAGVLRLKNILIHIVTS